MPGNMKQGTYSKDVMNLCFETSPPLPNSVVLTGLRIAQGGAYFPVTCPPGYSVSSPDLSGGVGLIENLCAQWTPWSSEVADRVAAVKLVGSSDRGAPSSGWTWSTQLPADKSPRVMPTRYRKSEEHSSLSTSSSHGEL